MQWRGVTGGFGLAVWGEQLIRVFRGSYDQTFGVNFRSAGQGENYFKEECSFMVTRDVQLSGLHYHTEHHTVRVCANHGQPGHSFCIL